MSETGVDNWSEDQLLQWIKGHHVNADNVESVSELRMLVKAQLELGNDDITREEEERSSSQRMIAEILKKDKAKRRDLAELYAYIKRFNRDCGRGTCLTEVYPNLNVEMDKLENDLRDKECAIVVAGEVSSGKSSLFNLLLGEDIFPTAHLACSSTISRLHNSTRKALEVTVGEHDHRLFGNLRDVRELQGHMRRYAMHSREGNERPCKQIDIFWPVPILPENILLVDVPGVGESEEMDRIVIDYLNKALACIYVLFSANAGGIQGDKLQMIIRERFRTANEVTSQDAFDNTLFVCNYWDVVEASGQDDEVWNDTIAKLESLIPNLDRDKVVKMSIKEASRHMELGIGKTDKFKALTRQFKSLLRKTLSAKTSHHYRIQQNLIGNIEGYLAKRRHLATLTREEKQRKMKETKLELEYIIKESDEVTRRIKELARQRLFEISQKLHSHIHEKDTKERFLNCKDERGPIASLKKDSGVLGYLIAQKVQCKLQNLISDWEKKHQMFADLQEDVKVQVEKFLSNIAKRLRRIDLDLTRGSDEKLFDLATIQRTNVPDISLTTGEKVAMVISAPIWIPIAIVGGLIAAPVALVVHGIERIFVCGRYSNNEFQHRMYHHIKSILETTLTEETLRDFLVETYFKSLSEQVDNVVFQNAREEAATRGRELSIIDRDCRSTEQLLRDISKAKPELDLLIGRFLCYELVYMSNDHIDDTEIKIGDNIGGGQFSDVYNATVDTRHVAVKVLKSHARPENICEQLGELQTFRALKHDNIVEYIGVHLYNREGSGEPTSKDIQPSWMSVCGKRVAFVLQHCDESLEFRVFRRYKLQDRLNSGSRDEALAFFEGMIKGICAALVYMHERDYMHRDLKISNVLLKDDIPKLTDFGLSRVQAFSHGTQAGTLTHMSPEVLSNKHYWNSTDIYSLGIMMWEMWYGRHAYTEEAYQNMNLLTFVQTVVAGQRPPLDVSVQMPTRLKLLVAKCWNADPFERPTAVALSMDIRDSQTSTTRTMSQPDVNCWSEDDLCQYKHNHQINAVKVECESAVRMLVKSRYVKTRGGVSSDAKSQDGGIETSQTSTTRTMSQPDVNCWSEDDLCQYIDNHQINADKVESVSELRMLVKSHYGKTRGGVSSDAKSQDDGIETSQTAESKSSNKKTIFGKPFEQSCIIDGENTTFQIPGSDVKVIFPNSLTTNTRIEVHGSSFHSISHIRKRFDLPTFEEIASPVTEYHVTGCTRFSDYTCVKLPFVGPRSEVKVWKFLSDEGITNTTIRLQVPLKGKYSNEHLFYEVEGESTCNVYTRSFSGFFCTTDGHRPLKLRAFLYASHKLFQPLNQHEVRIRMYIADEVMEFRDYSQTMNDIESMQDRFQKETKVLSLLEDDLTEDSNIEARVTPTEDSSNQWVHKPNPHTGQPIFAETQMLPLRDIVQKCPHCPGCHLQNDEIPYSVEWYLTNRQTVLPSVIFKGLVTVDCVKGQQRRSTALVIDELLLRPEDRFPAEENGECDRLGYIKDFVMRMADDKRQTLLEFFGLGPTSVNMLFDDLQHYYKPAGVYRRLVEAFSKQRLYEELDRLFDRGLIPKKYCQRPIQRVEHTTVEGAHALPSSNSD